MRIGLSLGGMATLTAIVIIGFASSASAKTLTGKWGGKSATTLEFLDGKKVKYCYKSKCTTQAYTGDRGTKIDFNWGRAKLTFTKTESGYDGTYVRVISSKVKVQ